MTDFEKTCGETGNASPAGIKESSIILQLLLLIIIIIMMMIN